MAKSKKVLSLALAVVMAISVLSIGAFAATTPTGAITVTADKTEGIQMGDTVTVTVTATAGEDYFVGPTAVPVTYDPAVFEASNVVGKNIFGDVTTDDTEGDPTDVVPNIDNAAGKVTVVITPIIENSPTAPNLNGQNVVLYTFTLTAKVDTEGSYNVAVLNDPKAADNLTGKLYMTSFDSSDASNAGLTNYGQTIDLTNATVTLKIGSAVQPADLELTEAGTAAGIIIDTNKTFGGQYAGAVYGFAQPVPSTFKTKNYITTNVQASNSGSIAVTTSDGKTTGSSKYGTGTTITVLNSDGSESGKVYVVVIFGDIDGNGSITNADVSTIKTLSKDTTLADNSVIRMAANTSGTTATTLTKLTNADVLAAKYWSTKKQFTASITITKHAEAHKKQTANYI